MYLLGGVEFRRLKVGRRLAGAVLQSDTGLFARIGPREVIQPQQAYAQYLYERGFPVPQVVWSGEHKETGEWCFAERSVGKETFHARFARETERHGSVQDDTLRSYLATIYRYIDAQMAPRNRTKTLCASSRPTKGPR